MSIKNKVISNHKKANKKLHINLSIKFFHSILQTNLKPINTLMILCKGHIDILVSKVRFKICTNLVTTIFDKKIFFINSINKLNQIHIYLTNNPNIPFFK